MAEKKDTLNLEIVTPDAIVFSGPVNSIVAPGEDGYFQILKDHTSYLSSIRVGEIKVETPDAEKHFATSGGYLEVFMNTVSVLAETAEEAEKIDIERAEEAKKRAEERISKKEPGTDIDRAEMAMSRALNRIRIARKRSY